MKLQYLIITASLLTNLNAMAQATTVIEVPVPTSTAVPNGQQTRPVPRMHDMMMKRHARHLEALKTSLKLMPEQENQWTAFAGSMRPHHPETRHTAIADMEKLTTPERIDKMNALKAQRDVEMKKRDEATKSFYLTLSDEQKKTFDQEAAKFMHRRGEARHGTPS